MLEPRPRQNFLRFLPILLVSAALVAAGILFCLRSVPKPVLPAFVPLATATTAATSPSMAPTSPPEPSTADSVNAHWLDAINHLRKDAGLRLLETDIRLVDTATEWANDMGARQTLSHERPNGETMHQWIDTKGIPFAERSSPDGRTSNYFTENIARFYTNKDPASMTQTLDKILAEFMAETPPDDAHKRSILSPDWNAVGVGWYVDKTDANNPRAYFVFHYGSLVLK